MPRGRVLATINMQKDRPLDVARAGLATVLTHRPGIVALQEWGSARNGILRNLAREGYSFARSSKGGGPILFDDRYGLQRCWGAVLSRSSFAGRLAGRKSTLPTSVAGVFLLHDDETADDIAVVNFHLTAEVQKDGRYRRDPAHLPRVLRHKREVRRLERIVRRQQRKGREVYLLGDTNFDGLRIRGLKSCWEGRDGGTLGHRAVDVVFAERHAHTVRTVATGSDHRAVVVTYKEH